MSLAKLKTSPYPAFSNSPLFSPADIPCMVIVAFPVHTFPPKSSDLVDPDPAKVRPAENVNPIPDTSLKSPRTVRMEVPVSVPVNPVQSKSPHEDVALIVTVPAPDDAVRNTFSPIGTDAPDAPPLVVDQLVVLFQFPVPPDTQYRSLTVAAGHDHPNPFPKKFPVDTVLFAPMFQVAPPLTRRSFDVT